MPRSARVFRRPAIFVDTSAWYALVDRGDPDHPIVALAFEANSGRLVTSNYVLDEVFTLVRFRLGLPVATAFGKELLRGEVARIERLKAVDEHEAWRIFASFDDQTFSFTDCTSFAVMSRLGTDTALAVDQDFRAYGLNCLP